MAAIVAGSLAVGAIVLASGYDAGWPRELADIEGSWILDGVRGAFDVAPPEQLIVSATAGTNVVRVSDGRRTAQFEIQGAGRLVFASGDRFEPLLRAGESEVYTMTHLCRPLPAWDHFVFYPDGQPIGADANRRSVTYERD